MAQTLPFVKTTMNISDIIIIYLACGAPFGVYFFLQNRKKLISSQLWLKSFFTVFVWIPYAFFILNDFATNNQQKKQIAEQNLLDESLKRIQKEFLDIKTSGLNNLSVFELREVLDRYVGLTMVSDFEQKTPADSENELLRISLRQNSQTAAKCLHRQNLKKFKFHQTLARQDFLKVILILKNSNSDSRNIQKLSLEMICLLNDEEAVEPLQVIFETDWQSKAEFPVNDLEKEVWKSREQKPLHSSL